jgi:hypothetical protein
MVRPMPELAAPADDHAIVSGKRIGPIALGMSTADVFNAMGEPTASFRIWNSHSWGSPGVSAGFTYTGPEWVRVIYTSDPRDKTPEGIHVGSTELEMRAKLGVPTRTIDRGLKDVNGNDAIIAYEFCYAMGIGFHCQNGSTVTSISVTIPGYCADP